MNRKPELNDFPHKTFEKLRFVDTDRQGHVNSSVFNTMLETGRAEILYNPNQSLAAENCSFVIAHLNLDFLAEITWPGQIDIGTKVTRIGRSSIDMEQAVYQNGRCAATAKTTIVHVNNSTRRSHPLGELAISALSTFCLTENELKEDEKRTKSRLNCAPGIIETKPGFDDQMEIVDVPRKL